MALSYIANPTDLIVNNLQKLAHPRFHFRHRLLRAIIRSNPRFRLDGWQLRLLIQEEKDKIRVKGKIFAFVLQK